MKNYMKKKIHQMKTKKKIIKYKLYLLIVYNCLIQTAAPIVQKIKNIVHRKARTIFNFINSLLIYFRRFFCALC